MRLSVLAIALTGTLALCVSSCGTTRRVSSEVRSRMYEVTRDTVREQVVEVHDTIREVTTITVQLGQAGDTVRVAQVTDRDRSRSMYDVRSKKEVVRVERDTVYIEKRDSLLVKSEELRVKSSLSHHTSAISHLLKWIFWIVVAVIVLIVVIRVKS